MSTVNCILVLLCVYGAFGIDMDINVLDNIEQNFNKSGYELAACDLALMRLKDGAKDLQEWALRMLDSTGKIPSGLYEWNIYEFGAFDECLAINFPEHDARGKYCLAAMSIPMKVVTAMNIRTFERPNVARTDNELDMPLKILWGLCIPDVCTAEDLSHYFPKEVIFEDEFCQSESDKEDLRPGDIATITFFATIFCIILVSTTYDYYLDKTNKVPYSKLLLAFSFLTNGRKLFASTHSADHIKCIGGIRTITIMWIVLGHFYLMAMTAPVSNLEKVTEFFMNESSMFIKTATVSVDTFFLIGGIVMVYSYMKMKKKLTWFNIPMYYFHRYLRLTPSLAILVLFHVTLLQYVGSGPVWPANYNYSTRFCEEYWWSTLLYVQNWVNPYKLCIGVTWYLCLDFQLFLLSPLALIPLKKYPKSTLSVVALLACVSIGVAFYEAWTNKFSPFANANAEEYTIHYYTALHARAAPWLMGVIIGYFIHQVKFKYLNLKLNKVMVAFLWICSIVLMLTILLEGNELVLKEHDNRWLNSTYLAFVRPSWSLAVAWVVFACILGYGGPVNDFLSLNIFQVMARITYSIYLIHFTILSAFAYSQRTPPRFSGNILYYYWAHMTVIIFLSIVFTLAFESPIIILEKALFRKSPPKPESKSNEANMTNEPNNITA